MKRVILFSAAVCACVSFAEEEPQVDATKLYMPSNWKYREMPADSTIEDEQIDPETEEKVWVKRGTCGISSEKGKEGEYFVTYNKDGVMTTAYGDAALIAMKEAFAIDPFVSAAVLETYRQSKMIEMLANSVADAFTGALNLEINGGTLKAEIKFKTYEENNAAAQEQKKEATTEVEWLNEECLELNPAINEIEFKDWSASSRYKKMLVNDHGLLKYEDIPIPSGGVTIDWCSISTNASGALSISNWNGGAHCDKSLDDIVWTGDFLHSFVSRFGYENRPAELHYVKPSQLGISNRVADVVRAASDKIITNLTTAGSTRSRCPIKGGVGLSYTEREGFTWDGLYEFDGWNDKVGIHFKREYGDVPFVGFAHAATQTDPEYLEVKYTNVFKLAESTLAAATNAIPPIVREEMEDYVPYELAKDDPINCNNHAFQVNANFETWFAINPGNSSAQINGTYVYIGTNTSFSGSVSLPPATSVNGESLTNIAAQAAAAVKSEDNSVTGIRVEDQGGTKYLIINNGGMQYKVALENL